MTSATSTADGHPTGRALPPGYYGATEVAIGDHYRTGRITVTESHITAFCGLSGDFFDIHVDDTFARSHGFSGRVAHGLLGLSMVDGLKNRAKVSFAAVASMGWNWRFRGPIMIGDTIEAVITVRACTPHPRREGQSRLTLGFSVLNQKGECVQEGETELLCLNAKPM
ncbi:MaoC family dehydratase [Arvimicrobium flavum]|uniref:MaoC family dehydratase n=1 Tax=Arvimicrobium flavum TaxID=3393320 RepID=UPI00237C0D88|nr:MaoC/PaaZ C-terminal domain-containing protein [Mesorhizobium shangrilense]